MGRREPKEGKIPEFPKAQYPVALPRGEAKRPQDYADKVEPFYRSNAYLWHELYLTETLSTAPDGVQLITYFHVPAGRTGFVKQIRVAPYINTQYTAFIADHYMDFGGLPFRPNPFMGIYTTPAGWESMWAPGEGVRKPPFWRWHLKFIKGDIDQIRRGKNIRPFDINDPSSWYLVSPQPVPRRAYPGGIPGSVPGDWPAQKIQRTGAEESGSVHVLVPEDTTVALFVDWKQEEFIAELKTLMTPVVELFPERFPLLPSFGVLVGYTQTNSTKPGGENARYGWDG